MADVDGLSTSILVQALSAVLNGDDLDAGRMRAVMQALLTGTGDESVTAALLTALRMKGETATELAAAALTLREHMVRLETGRTDVLDTCGTGGDEKGTFNISTATALVVAGTGLPVVKHGNRAVSSRSGSADVLALLGLSVEAGPDFARRCLDSAGLAFCLAPSYHPAMRHVASLRRRLGIRTFFNCLGPLLNPAQAPYQLVGVGRPQWLDPLAGALARLGIRRAFVVCGSDGLDEVTLAGRTWVREVSGGQVFAREWSPSDFALEPCGLAEIRVDSPEQSADVLRRILDGRPGPAARVVIANAAAALLAAERVRSLREGADRAAEAIAGGAARDVLRRLVESSRQPPAAS